MDAEVPGGRPAAESRLEAAVDKTTDSRRVHSDADRRDIRICDAVIGTVGERIGSSVAGPRRVSEADMPPLPFLGIPSYGPLAKLETPVYI